MKGESGPEVAGFAEAARRHTAPLRAPAGALDTADYAGRTREPFLGLAADFIAAAAGVPVVRHGNGAAPEFAGRRSLFDTLRALGVEPGPRPGSPLQFIHVSQVCPPLDRLLHLRRELGVRSAAHVVARLLDPAATGVHLLGIAHRPTLDLMASALRQLGARRALLVDGVAGSEELPMDADAGVCEVRDGEVRNHRLGAREFGLRPGSVGPVKDAAEDAALVESILGGTAAGPARDGALLNGALRLYAAGRTDSKGEALRLVREALDSGKAFSLLEQLRG
jgi:anthranilate phosphoribosyltransferase